jgi:hypothetical protein
MYHRLADVDRDRRRLVVAQRDFVFELVDAATFSKVDLLPLAHHVERVADLDVERFVLWRVRLGLAPSTASV